MIISTVIVASANPKEFSDRLGQAIADLQTSGLIVEILYKPVSTKDEYPYIVHNALVIGRKEVNDYAEQDI